MSDLLPPRLLRAYRATRYEAAGAAVWIGWRSAAMDATLGRIGARTGCLITAWNPLSRRRPEGWNRRMQLGLAAAVRRYATLPASGTLRRWHEDHLLVAADPRAVRRLARRFRQRGVVVVARQQRARLALLDWGDG